MKTKIITLLIACLTLTACGSSQPEQDVTTASETTTLETTADTEASTSASERLGLADTGITELYKTVFLTYANGIGGMTFDDAKSYAQSLSFAMSYTEPGENDLGQITILDKEGNSVWVMTYPDSFGVETVSMVEYKHAGKYYMSVSDEYHGPELKYSAMGSDFPSLRTCERAIFGETSE